MIENTYWLWYPGDFEIHQGLLQNFTREERDYDWPAYWYMDDCHRNVFFRKKYQIKQTTKFKVHAQGQGYVLVNGQKYSFETTITCSVGTNDIQIYVGNTKGLPTVYVEGTQIKSTSDWMVSNFLDEQLVGYSQLYMTSDQDPNQVYYQIEAYQPVEIVSVNGGVLYDFRRAINGKVKLQLNGISKITLCYGESQTEALDIKNCYYKQEDVTESTEIRKRAFRYLYVPSVTNQQVTVTAYHEYFDYQELGKLETDNPLINQIWTVAASTFKLCSNLFFTDGIKRDRWIWSGDAYQCYLINQYLFFDEGLNERTILALRGQTEIKQHLNTIVDYSLLWLIGIQNHFMMSGNLAFLKTIYPKMVQMMSFIKQQLDDNGFIYGRENDWIFIDWSEFDQEGPFGPEQILLWRAYQAMVVCGQAINSDVHEYMEAQLNLKQQIMTYFWSDERQAFIDSYESGKQHVTRHANIFAILFDFVDQRTQQELAHHVLLDKQITQITTPYFKFFEADALGKVGLLAPVYEQIKSYWGGMLGHDAVTFWEEYNANDQDNQHYEMYGDPYGKSLCHAWGASPIYLLSRYFIGLRPTTPGYATFEIAPNLNFFGQINCELPIGDGIIKLKLVNQQLTIRSTKAGGTLIINNQKIPLIENQDYVLPNK